MMIHKTRNIDIAYHSSKTLNDDNDVKLTEADCSRDLLHVQYKNFDAHYWYIEA